MNHADRSLLRGTGQLVCGELTAKAASFAAWIALAHHFGADGFGAMNAVLSIVLFGTMFSVGGTEVAALRMFASGEACLGSIASTIIAIRLLMGLVLYAILIVLAGLLLPGLSDHRVLIVILGALLLSGAGSLGWVSKAVERPQVLALANFATQAGFGLLAIFAVAAGGNLWTVAAAMVAADLTASIGVLCWFRSTCGGFERPLPVRSWPGIAYASLVIGAGKTARSLALRSDLVLLVCLLPMTAVGYYAGAYKLFHLCLSFAGAYFVMLLPRLLRHSNGNTVTITAESQHCLRRASILAIPAVVIMGVAGEVVLRTCFGPGFAVGAASLWMLLGALGVFFIAEHFRQALLASGKHRAEFFVSASALIVHVALKLWLVPTFGMEGAALGTLLGEGAFLALAWSATRTHSTWIVAAPGSLHRRSVPGIGHFGRVRIDHHG